MEDPHKYLKERKRLGGQDIDGRTVLMLGLKKEVDGMGWIHILRKHD